MSKCLVLGLRRETKLGPRKNSALIDFDRRIDFSDKRTRSDVTKRS